MTPFALVRAVVPTPNTRVPSDPLAIVLAVLVLALVVLGIGYLIRKVRNGKGGKG